MKIALAQIKPISGDVASNIAIHKKYIHFAIEKGADFIVFPELSLTGYEPNLAASLAFDPQDTSLDDFQELSDTHQITIGLGMPIRTQTGMHIGMLLFQPLKTRQVYSKKYLHADEEPFFVSGDHFPVLHMEGKNIALAICYEVFVPAHTEAAFVNGADMYLASVAKSARGVAKAAERLPEIAVTHSVPVLMVNAIGYCDNFESAGHTAVWNAEGKLLAQLDDQQEGVLVFDTENGLVESYKD